MFLLPIGAERQMLRYDHRVSERPAFAKSNERKQINNRTMSFC